MHSSRMRSTRSLLYRGGVSVQGFDCTESNFYNCLLENKDFILQRKMIL